MDRFDRYSIYLMSWGRGSAPPSPVWPPDPAFADAALASGIGVYQHAHGAPLLSIDGFDRRAADIAGKESDDEPDVGPSARDKRELEDAQVRLRQLIAAGGVTDTGDRWLFDAAADEIVRLRGELERTHVKADYWHARGARNSKPVFIPLNGAPAGSPLRLEYAEALRGIGFTEDGGVWRSSDGTVWDDPRLLWSFAGMLLAGKTRLDGAPTAAPGNGLSPEDAETLRGAGWTERPGHWDDARGGGWVKNAPNLETFRAFAAELRGDGPTCGAANYSRPKAPPADALSPGDVEAIRGAGWDEVLGGRWRDPADGIIYNIAMPYELGRLRERAAEIRAKEAPPAAHMGPGKATGEESAAGGSGSVAEEQGAAQGARATPCPKCERPMYLDLCGACMRKPVGIPKPPRVEAGQRWAVDLRDIGGTIEEDTVEATGDELARLGAHGAKYVPKREMLTSPRFTFLGGPAPQDPSPKRDGDQGATQADASEPTAPETPSAKRTVLPVDMAEPTARDAVAGMLLRHDFPRSADRLARQGWAPADLAAEMRHPSSDANRITCIAALEALARGEFRPTESLGLLVDIARANKDRDEARAEAAALRAEGADLKVRLDINRKDVAMLRQEIANAAPETTAEMRPAEDIAREMVTNNGWLQDDSGGVALYSDVDVSGARGVVERLVKRIRTETLRASGRERVKAWLDNLPPEMAKVYEELKDADPKGKRAPVDAAAQAEEPSGMRIEKRDDGEWIIGIPNDAHINDCPDERNGWECHYHVNGEHVATHYSDVGADGAERVTARWPIAAPAREVESSRIAIPGADDLHLFSLLPSSRVDLIVPKALEPHDVMRAVAELLGLPAWRPSGETKLDDQQAAALRDWKGRTPDEIGQYAESVEEELPRHASWLRGVAVGIRDGERRAGGELEALRAKVNSMAGQLDDIGDVFGGKEGRADPVRLAGARMDELRGLRSKYADWQRMFGVDEPENVTGTSAAMQRARDEGIEEGERRAKAKAAELISEWDGKRLATLALRRSAEPGTETWARRDSSALIRRSCSLDLSLMFDVEIPPDGSGDDGAKEGERRSLQARLEAERAAVQSELDAGKRVLAVHEKCLATARALATSWDAREQRMVSKANEADARGDDLYAERCRGRGGAAFLCANEIRKAFAIEPTDPGKPPTGPAPDADPVLRALENAPVDDEPETAAEVEAMKAGAAGPFIPHADVMAGVCVRAHADGIVEGLNRSRGIFAKRCQGHLLREVDGDILDALAKAGTRIAPADLQPHGAARAALLELATGWDDMADSLRRDARADDMCTGKAYGLRNASADLRRLLDEPARDAAQDEARALSELRREHHADRSDEPAVLADRWQGRRERLSRRAHGAPTAFERAYAHGMRDAYTVAGVEMRRDKRDASAPTPEKASTAAPDREQLGRAVHDAGAERWAHHETWEELDGSAREDACAVGERLFAMGVRWATGADDPELDELARLIDDERLQEAKVLLEKVAARRGETDTHVVAARWELEIACAPKGSGALPAIPRLFPVVSGPLAALAERIEGVIVKAFAEPADGERRGPAAARWVLRLVDEHLQSATRVV